jgi:hypothetical protein
MRAIATAICLATLPMLTGCRGLLFPLILATRIAVVAAAAVHPRVVVVESPQLPPPLPEAYYSHVYEVSPLPPPPPSAIPLPPAQPPAPPPDGQLQPFDATEAHAEINSVDPSSCWPSGSVHGYGRARVTFAPSGTVQLVEITNPVHGQAPDSECISTKYGAATVQPFGGPSVAVYTTFYVR